MSFFSMFGATEIYVAIMIYAALSFVEPFGEAWLHDALRENAALRWSWDEFLAPLVRALIVLLFVIIAYPALFALREAPGIGALLIADFRDLSTLVGLVFLAGFAVALVPVMGRHGALALPLQGCCATAYLFAHLCNYLGATRASAWPGIDILLAMLLAGYLGHRVAHLAEEALGDSIERWFLVSDGKLVVLHVIDLLAQIPVILLYGYGLGRQIAIY